MKTGGWIVWNLYRGFQNKNRWNFLIGSGTWEFYQLATPVDWKQKIENFIVVIEEGKHERKCVSIVLGRIVLVLPKSHGFPHSTRTQTRTLCLYSLTSASLCYLPILIHPLGFPSIFQFITTILFLQIFFLSLLPIACQCHTRILLCYLLEHCFPFCLDWRFAYFSRMMLIRIEIISKQIMFLKN